jgi:predicted GTPase
MKVRKLRKRTQGLIRRNRRWHWAVEKFVRAVVTATNKMSKAMQEAYEKSREEQHDQRASTQHH